MKRNEAEQWLKESLDKLDFTPPEHGWERLRADIEHPKKKTWVLPVWVNLKVAVSVALVLTTGMLLYSLQKDQTTSYVSIERSASNQVERNNKPTVAVAEKTEPIAPAQPSSAKLSRARKHIARSSAHRATIPVFDKNERKDRVEDNIGVPTMHSEVVSEPIVARQPSKLITETNFQEPSLSPGNVINNKLNLGVAARFGTTSVGGLQYQVGIVAQKNITGKFFARATLAMATTDVKYTQQNSFERVSVFSALNASVDKKNVDVEYGGNILSIGLAPNVGFQVTSWLAVSCGLAIHHNLEQSLTRKNDEALAPEMLSNQIIDEQKSVGKWDAGLTGGASCRASRRLTIDLQYRYGLSTYLYFNGRPVRNSGLGVGINYLFRKD